MLPQPYGPIGSLFEFMRAIVSPFNKIFPPHAPSVTPVSPAPTQHGTIFI
jgi:hypothetical protein